MAKPVSYMGLPLKNPVIAAAGPWACDHAAIQRAIDAGAGAVVTETITLEGSGVIYPRIYARDGEMLNTTLYSALPLEAWEQELARIDRRDSFVICNIRGSTPSELSYIAAHVERWGADGLELCPFTPIGAKLESARTDPQEIYEMLRRVADAVDIPISIRLPAHLACTRAFVRAVERAGARAICTSETLQALWGVDLERRASRVPTFGGYSGPHLLPVTQATVAMLSQLTGCEISAMGGITGAEAALECMMLGASTVQIGSAILLRGYEVIGEVAAGADAWMRGHGLSDYGEIVGAALPTLSSFEELYPVPMAAHLRPGCDAAALPAGAREDCRRACLCGAIGEGMEVDAARCNGCGLCASLLPGLYEMKRERR